MRLFEIDDADRTWAKMSDIDLDIDKSHDLAIGILNILKSTRSQTRIQQLLPTVEKQEENMFKILNAALSDDPTTSALKEKAARYLNEIQQLKKAL